MNKKLCLTLFLVILSSVCFASEPTTVSIVKDEIASYKNLTKLQKAQMLVSHKSIETETKLRRESYLHHPNKENPLPKPKTEKPSVTTHDCKYRSNVKPVRTNNSNDSLKIAELEKQLAQSKASEEKLQKQNDAMKQELVQSIEVMKKLKEQQRK